MKPDRRTKFNSLRQWLLMHVEDLEWANDDMARSVAGIRASSDERQRLLNIMAGELILSDYNFRKEIQRRQPCWKCNGRGYVHTLDGGSGTNCPDCQPDCQPGAGV